MSSERVLSTTFRFEKSFSPSFSFCVLVFLTVSYLDSSIARYIEVVVVVWFFGVVRVRNVSVHQQAES